MNQSEPKLNTGNRRQAQENTCEQVVIGLSFTSDWSRKWHKIFLPITERSKLKPKQNANYVRHSIENRSNLVNLVLGFTYLDTLGFSQTASSVSIQIVWAQDNHSVFFLFLS